MSIEHVRVALAGSRRLHVVRVKLHARLDEGGRCREKLIARESRQIGLLLLFRAAQRNRVRGERRREDVQRGRQVTVSQRFGRQHAVQRRRIAKTAVRFRQVARHQAQRPARLNERPRQLRVFVGCTCRFAQLVARELRDGVHQQLLLGAEIKGDHARVNFTPIPNSVQSIYARRQSLCKYQIGPLKTNEPISMG